MILSSKTCTIIVNLQRCSCTAAVYNIYTFMYSVRKCYTYVYILYNNNTQACGGIEENQFVLYVSCTAWGCLKTMHFFPIFPWRLRKNITTDDDRSIEGLLNRTALVTAVRMQLWVAGTANIGITCPFYNVLCLFYAY